MSRLDRDRLDELSARFDRRSEPSGAGCHANLVQVYDGGSIPTATPAVFLTHPVLVDTDDTEGDAPTYTGDGTTTIPVVVLGSTVPAAGDYLIASAVGGKWVAESGGIAEGCRSLCECPHMPSVLELTDSALNLAVEMTWNEGSSSWVGVVPYAFPGGDGCGPAATGGEECRSLCECPHMPSVLELTDSALGLTVAMNWDVDNSHWIGVEAYSYPGGGGCPAQSVTITYVLNSSCELSISWGADEDGCPINLGSPGGGTVTPVAMSKTDCVLFEATVEEVTDAWTILYGGSTDIVVTSTLDPGICVTITYTVNDQCELSIAWNCDGDDCPTDAGAFTCGTTSPQSLTKTDCILFEASLTDFTTGWAKMYAPGDGSTDIVLFAPGGLGKCCVAFYLLGCGGGGLQNGRVNLWTDSGKTSLVATATANANGYVVMSIPAAGTYWREVVVERFEVYEGSHTFSCEEIETINMLSVSSTSDGYHCWSACAYPIADVIHLTTSEFGEITINWQAGTIWQGSTTYDYTASGVCPGGTVTLDFTLGGDSPSWTYDLDTDCPDDSGAPPGTCADRGPDASQITCFIPGLQEFSLVESRDEYSELEQCRCRLWGVAGSPCTIPGETWTWTE